MNRHLIITVLLVVLAGVMVGQGTYAYFSDASSSEVQSFAAGTLMLNDPLAMGSWSADITNMAPGDNRTATVTIQNTGSLPLEFEARVVTSGALFGGATPATAAIDCGSTPAALAAGASTSCNVTVDFPAQANNDYQGSTGALRVDAEAHQVGSIDPWWGVYTVTNTTNSGPGSLRQAILNANAHPGADTINFDPAVTGTITLTSGQLNITSNMTIDGPGADVLTLRGNHASHVLASWTGATVNLEGLAVANGSSAYGGGILNYRATLTVTSCTFSGNSSNNSYGGGIDNDGGIMTVIGSTFSGNIANNGHGGGIFNNSVLTVINSTFSGNFAGYGGGIANTGTLTVKSSTLSGNSANSGGAIYRGAGAVTLRNTIVANSPTGVNCSGTIADGSGNLQYPGTSCGGTITSVDPLLDPVGLQNNGGPTWTIALLPGSPAIDAAVAGNCPATDQRGVLRPQGAGCDIGAFEKE